jgi:predicted MFS family arabinose efflux permease
MRSSTATTPAGGGNGWELVAAGTALIAVTYGLARYGYGLFLPTLREEFSLSASAAGRIASVSYASYCASICLGGALTARGAARGSAILAGATATTGTAMIAVAHSTAALGIGVAVAGASTGLASPPLVALVAGRVRPATRDRAQTAVNSGTGLGVIVAGPAALLLAGEWRWSWALFAAVSLAVTIAIAATTRCTAPGVRRRGRRASESPQAGAERRAPAPWRAPGAALAVAAIGLGLASSAYLTFGRDLLESAGMATDSAVGAWVALGVAGILAAATGDLVGRYRIDAVWSALLLLMSLATAALALGPGSLPVVLASAALFGASFYALSGVLILWAARLVPESAAMAVANAFLLVAGGQLVGATAVGMLVDQAGWTASFLAAAAAGLAVTPLAGGARPCPAPAPY